MKGLYIHIPFCKRRCLYCSFAISTYNYEKEEKYIEKIISDLSLINDPIDSIYIGGGTPSRLSILSLEKLLKYLYNKFNFAYIKEYTFEFNPDDVCEEKLMILKKYGINRISLGVQSFDDNELKNISRQHSAKDAINAIAVIKKYFLNLSIDLILALPDATISSIENNVAKFLELDIPHLSIYALQIESGTALFNKFKKGELNILDDDKQALAYERIIKMLSNKGIFRYEVSNFAKPSFESYFNLKYWNQEEYYGVGLAASSYIDGRRYHNLSDFDEFIEKNEIIEDEIQDKNAMMNEMVILAFRKIEGLNLETFKNKFDCDFLDIYKDIIYKYSKCFRIENGYIAIKDEYIFSMNEILLEFI